MAASSNAAVFPPPSLKASLASLPTVDFFAPSVHRFERGTEVTMPTEILKESTGNLGKWHPDRSYLDTIGAFAFIPV